MLRFLRRALFTPLALLRLGSRSGLPIVNGYTRLTARTRLGSNVNFNGMIVHGSGEVVIGDNFHSGSGCRIITQSHNHRGQKVPYDETFDVYTIRIGDNVWLGMDVTIIGNVTIGPGAIIQVGSVVVSDIPACAIAGGHPARVFATRDRARYEQLVAERRVH